VKRAPFHHSAVRVIERDTLPLFASVMRHPVRRLAPVHTTGSPGFVSSGLLSLDRALRGGFPLGAASLVAGRPRAGVTSMLMGMALTALKQGRRVAYFSERLHEDQIRGRFVVLESRVNGYRFRAGFVTDEDRAALASARERIAWSELTLVAQPQISVSEVAEHLFSYRPELVLLDLTPRPLGDHDQHRYAVLMEGVQELCDVARHHHVAAVLRHVLPKADHPPNRLELPGVGAMAEQFAAVVLLHREEVTNPDAAPDEAVGLAELHVVRVAGRDVGPRVVPVRFDQRFAGLLDL
jgi:replicative DNA helicase